MRQHIKSGIYFGSLVLSLSSCSDSTQFTQGSLPSERTKAPQVANQENTDKSSGTSETAPKDSSDSIADTSKTASNISDPILNDPSTASTTIDPTSFNAGAKTGSNPSIVEQYKQQCSQGKKKSMIQTINFPATENCRFGTAGNLARRDTYLQAIEGQSSTITLPDKSLLCGLELSSPAATIQYDDFMILTLNGYVLLSSNKKILEGLEGSLNSAYKWNFSQIRGVAIDFNAAPYCLGKESSLCVVPETDVPGKFQLDINPDSLINLADSLVDQHKLNFSLIATGDNDDRDCRHTAISLDFAMQYIEIP